VSANHGMTYVGSVQWCPLHLLCKRYRNTLYKCDFQYSYFIRIYWNCSSCRSKSMS